MARILIVDDDRSIRRTLEKFLGGEGYDVTTAHDAPSAVAALTGDPAIDLMLLDLGLPGGSGFDVLSALGARDDAPAVVVVTARDDMQSTVKAIQLGAYEYLVKPVDIDRLGSVVKSALASREVRGELVELAARGPEVGDILGKSAAIRDVWKQIGAVSTTRAPVLIRGESGTGKELVARAIHNAGELGLRGAGRTERERPFVAVNCTALAPGVLESELFGHVKGAFTGAVADRPGRFELAGRGTIFLDEIAEIPMDLQAKLLRVLQERTFERVGDARAVPLDARVIAATHRDLAQMVKQGTFREDLYYRLRVVEIHLPPLRERATDIPVLVEGLLAKITRDLGKEVRYVTPAALAKLSGHAWPGNVRELENTLTRAVVLAKSDVLDETLLPLGAPTAPPSDGDVEGALPTLREIERRHIARVLAHTEWNKRRACAILDISRPTLDRKIEEYALRKEET
ncbi:MAG TPA: sigma-54 dependent transcriptional regulator [Kofleriaceae bacterium]|nr:sigma-54 dependent transcriptional regulator [Kofleriaceae bacterium]